MEAVAVQAGHWYAGKEIRIPVSLVERVNYLEAKVIVTLTMAEIEKTAENELAKAGAGG